MVAVGIVLLVLALFGAVAYLVLKSRPRQDAGVTSFRRHIDALSPEARREVHERVKRNKEGEG